MNAQQQFDEDVARIVAQIPSGHVATYGDVAAAAGYPGYARHVGQSMQRLPEGTSLPWYRVINAQGGISARADSESTNEQRSRLLAEGVAFTRHDRVNLIVCRWTFG